MYVALAQVVVQLAGDGVGLADLLRLEALALQHVVEIGVAADVQLHGAFQAHAALAEEASQHTMHDGGAYLAFDVIADHGKIGLFDALLPVMLAPDEDRNEVDQAASSLV